MIVIQQAIASPTKPTVSWYFGNQPITPGGRHGLDVTKEGDLFYVTLKVPNVSAVCNGVDIALWECLFFLVHILFCLMKDFTGVLTCGNDF